MITKHKKKYLEAIKENKPAKPSKLRNKKWECNNKHLHDSMLEAGDCNILHILQNSGKIKDLQIQPEFELLPGEKALDGSWQRAIKYIPDFSFYDNEQKKFRIIDSKGFRTAVYSIKRKLFNSFMKDRGIMVEEII